jgi:hypothetical protein
MLHTRWWDLENQTYRREKIQKRYPYGLLGQGFVGKLTIKYPCAGPSIFVLLTAATWPYLLRLRMAIPMHRASPPYNTKQPNINIIHADNGILHSPYTSSDLLGRFHNR